jgi:Flp pilus assembly pilin Flp
MLFLKVLSMIQERTTGERGAVAAEYAVLLSLIAIALVGAVGFLSGAIGGAMNEATTVINGTP